AGLRWCQSGLRRLVWCGLLVYRCGICLLGWGLVGGGGYSTVGVDADVEFAFGLGDVGGDDLSFAAGAFGQVADQQLACLGEVSPGVFHWWLSSVGQAHGSTGVDLCPGAS